MPQITHVRTLTLKHWTPEGLTPRCATDRCKGPTEIRLAYRGGGKLPEDVPACFQCAGRRARHHAEHHGDGAVIMRPRQTA